MHLAQSIFFKIFTLLNATSPIIHDVLLNTRMYFIVGQCYRASDSHAALDACSTLK